MSATPERPITSAKVASITSATSPDNKSSSTVLGAMPPKLTLKPAWVGKGFTTAPAAGTSPDRHNKARAPTEATPRPRSEKQAALKARANAEVPRQRAK